jgi:integrase
MTKRSHGDGGIDPRGENVHRLRYRVGGKRFTKTFHGTLTEARKELRALIRSGDTGEHVDPNKLTVGDWVDQWIAAGAPGQRREKVSERTLERYTDLLQVHVKPILAPRRLQQLQPQEIDKLYSDMAEAAIIAPRTQHHVHVVLGACLATATRKGLITANPMLRVEQVPSVRAAPISGTDEDTDQDDIGEGLTDAELAQLVAGFGSSTIFPIVALAAATGARRNEILALRWTDLDTEKKTLRIERAWEQTKKYGLRLKPPKTARGLRTIDLDDATVSMLISVKETLQRLAKGIPDGASVDLSLIKLPAAALIFPNPPEPGIDFSLTAPRIPRSVTQAFARRAETIKRDKVQSTADQAQPARPSNFGNVRLHDLRGIHSTALLDAGIPVHTVAQRIGDDPATLLRNYTKRKRTKTADAKLSDALAALAAGFLKS